MAMMRFTREDLSTLVAYDNCIELIDNAISFDCENATTALMGVRKEVDRLRKPLVRKSRAVDNQQSGIDYVADYLGVKRRDVEVLLNTDNRGFDTTWGYNKPYLVRFEGAESQYVNIYSLLEDTSKLIAVIDTTNGKVVKEDLKKATVKGAV